MVDRAEQYFNDGLNFAKLHRYAEAIASFDKAIAINPNNPANFGVWSIRGLALDGLQRYAEAVDSYDKALAIKPDYADAWNNRGDSLLNLDRNDEAVTSYDKAIAIEPDYAIAWRTRGRALDELGRYAEAITSYDKALDIDPNDAIAWYNRGNALRNLGRNDDAIDSYDKAIDIDPKNTTKNFNAWYNRGDALYNLGKYAEAVISYDKALAINPNFTQARKNREIALLKQGATLTPPCLDNFKKSTVAKPKPEPDIIQNSPNPWNKGNTIQNRYEIIDIKKGGMGIVYIAHDHEWDKIIAIKIFQDKFLWDEDVIQKFMAEAETWIELERHTNIVFANCVSRIEGKPLLFLEYIDSGNLEQFIGKFTIEESLDFAIQFCNGMEYAYQKLGVIHRDIKPGNVMAQKDPRFRFGYAFKITDFGLVKILGNEFLNESNKVSTGMGTIPFMPPEQFPVRIKEKFSFKGEMTTKSDIYSFGITLYFLLTGKLPFEDMDEIFTKSPERPKNLNPKILERLDILIIKCLEKNPNNRYNDFTELKEKLIELYNDLTGERYVIVGKIVPLTGEDWSNKGLALDNLEKFQDAIKCYDKSLEINPRLCGAWSNKGGSLDELGKYQEAIECFDKALEIDPRHGNAWNNKGNALKHLGNYQDAIGCYDKALELNPRSAEAWINKGLALAEFGKPQKAILNLEKALEIDPRSAEAWINKGLAHNGLGQLQEAITCYDKALEINPRDDFAWSNKGVSLRKIGRLQDAIKCYDKALVINPNDAVTWNNRGSALSHPGKYQEAIECYNKAIELNPRDADAWGNKGAALRELGKSQEAIGCFVKFIELAHPQDALQVEQAKQIINQLRR